MSNADRPLLCLYLVWHPFFSYGVRIAERLRRYFRGSHFLTVAGAPGVSVLYRSDSAPGMPVPLPIDWDDAEATAVVLLVESSLVSDPAWWDYAHNLSRRTKTSGLLARLFPVALESEIFNLVFDEQAMRWDCRGGEDEDRGQRLIRGLIRMLWHHFGRNSQTTATGPTVADYLARKV